MAKTNRDKRPYVPPVRKITLSEDNTKLRIILLVACLLIAAAALTVGLTGLLNRDTGWQTVEAASSERNLSGEFLLRYDFSRSSSASADRRALSRLYTDAMEQAYVVFSTQEEASGNLRDVNAHVNETVTVDPLLYRALETVEACGSRYLYLAPAYVEYDRIFLSETEAEASRYDPARDPELRQYLQQIADFAADPDHIRVALLEDHQVCLQVSEDYLAFASEQEIDTLLDFGWTRNAFVVDYVTQLMQEQGFTAGYVTSYDGFTGNPDAHGSYTINVFARLADEINLPARLQYTAPMSLVVFRDYGMTEQDRWRYRAMPDGSIVTAMLDPADGRSKSAVHDLLCCSETIGCAELALQAAPCFVADSFEPQLLTAKGIHGVWSEGTVLHCTDASLNLSLNGDCAVAYTIEP